MEVIEGALVGSMMGMFGYYLGRYAALGSTKDEAVVFARIDLLRHTGGEVPSEKMQDILDGLIDFVESENGFKEDAK